MIFAVVEGFGDLDNRADCWDENTVELFVNEAPAVAFADRKTFYGDPPDGFDSDDYWVIVEDRDCQPRGELNLESASVPRLCSEATLDDLKNYFGWSVKHGLVYHWDDNIDDICWRKEPTEAIINQLRANHIQMWQSFSPDEIWETFGPFMDHINDKPAGWLPAWGVGGR